MLYVLKDLLQQNPQGFECRLGVQKDAGYESIHLLTADELGVAFRYTEREQHVIVLPWHSVLGISISPSVYNV